MSDRDLASLGDAFINFAYSLALSSRRGKPAGAKVKGTLLAEALRRAALREEFRSRVSSHDLADAAEALIVYSWLRGCLTLEEIISILEKAGTPVDGLTKLLERIKARRHFSLRAFFNSSPNSLFDSRARSTASFNTSSGFALPFTRT